MIPPALRWVQSFAESVNRAMLDEVERWNVRGGVDPLQWVVELRLIRPLRTEEVGIIRYLLQGWAEANDAAYRRSEWKDRDFRALVYIKGLRPEKDNSPYEERNAQHRSH